MQVNRPLTMKKEGIQTRNRKISTKQKKNASRNELRFDPPTLFLEGPPNGFGTIAPYQPSFNPMQFPGQHPSMGHSLAATPGFSQSHHHMLHPSHHQNHAVTSHSAQTNGTLTLNIPHSTVVHTRCG